MSKHTQGPWKVTEAFGLNDKLCFHEIRPAAEGVPEIIASTWGRPNLPNARLIAAAPELLNALESAYSRLKRYEKDFSQISLEDIEDLIEATIAKARGTP